MCNKTYTTAHDREDKNLSTRFGILGHPELCQPLPNVLVALHSKVQIATIEVNGLNLKRRLIRHLSPPQEMNIHLDYYCGATSARQHGKFLPQLRRRSHAVVNRTALTEKRNALDTWLLSERTYGLTGES